MKIENTIKNIIFDLGGVILDIDINKTIDAFKQLGFTNIDTKISKEEVSNTLNDFEKGKFSTRELEDKIKNIGKFECSSEEFLKAWNAILIGYPKERIELLLSFKKQYRIFLLSNTNIEHYHAYSKILRDNYNIDGLEAIFEKAYFSQDLGLRKPDIKIYEHVLKKENLNPSETLYLDDLEENLIAPKELGLKTQIVSKEITINKIFDDLN